MLAPRPWYQLLQIEKMLRLVRGSRPLRRRVKLNTHKIAYFPIDAVTYRAREFLLGRSPSEYRVQRNSDFQLQTRAGSRDIFQNGLCLLCFACAILPTDLDQIRAQHPNFRSPLRHTIHIGWLAGSLPALAVNSCWPRTLDIAAYVETPRAIRLRPTARRPPVGPARAPDRRRSVRRGVRPLRAPEFRHRLLAAGDNASPEGDRDRRRCEGQ
jgi:hypothetical protein